MKKKYIMAGIVTIRVIVTTAVNGYALGECWPDIVTKIFDLFSIILNEQTQIRLRKRVTTYNRPLFYFLQNQEI